jgi:hypothetical protein
MDPAPVKVKFGSRVDVGLDRDGNLILRQSAEGGGLSVIFVPFARLDSLLKLIAEVAAVWRSEQQYNNN